MNEVFKYLPELDPVHEIGAFFSVEEALVLERSWNLLPWLWLTADEYDHFLDSDFGWPWP